MKLAIRFVLLFYAISFFILWVGKPFVEEASVESMSYLLWYFIINAVLSLCLYPPLYLLMLRLKLPAVLNAVLSFILLVLIWNIIPKFEAGIWLTEETFHPLFNNGSGRYDPLFMLVHFSLLLGFVLTTGLSWLIDRRLKLEAEEENNDD